MNTSRLISLLLLATVGLSACTIKTAGSASDDAFKKIDADLKKNNDEILKMTASLEQGGQPGLVKISGIIVKENTELDERIQVQVSTGQSKDGKLAPLAATSNAKLSSTLAHPVPRSLSENKNLIAVGCDQDVVTEMALENELNITPVPAETTKDVLSIDANTIMLCGKLESIKHTILFISADKLILTDVYHTQMGLGGSLVLKTNHLVLNGANQLTAKGIDSSMPLSLTASIELQVAQEISSDQVGKLGINSIGSNYTAEEK